MAKINLISPPDKLHTNNFSFCVVNLTQGEQQDLSHYLSNKDFEKDINIYVYNNESNPSWLLDAVNGNKTTYINLDNTSDISVKYISYLLSLSSVYYSTQDKTTQEAYSLLNHNLVENINAYMETIFNGN